MSLEYSHSAIYSWSCLRRAPAACFSLTRLWTTFLVLRSGNTPAATRQQLWPPPKTITDVCTPKYIGESAYQPYSFFFALCSFRETVCLIETLPPTTLFDFHIAHASEESGPTWSVRFAEDAAAPVVVDAGSDLYDQQVEEQMAAAAALVRKSSDCQSVCFRKSSQ